VSRDSSELLNVSLLAPQGVVSEIAHLSRMSDGLFVVDNATRWAHMTLYMARFPTQHRSNVLSRLRKILRAFRSVKLNQLGYRVTNGGYYEVSYEKGRDLGDLQHAISQSLLSFRYSPLHPVVEDYFSFDSPAQSGNAALTGYDLDGAQYRPHITITRLSTGSLTDAYPRRRRIFPSLPRRCIFWEPIIWVREWRF
jgi:hypothetical protein